MSQKNKAVDYPDKARQIIWEELTHHQSLNISVDQIYIVWFAYILGGWKALVSTNLEDGFYYEVTHNFQKNESYLDTYVKVDNRVYPEERENIVRGELEDDDSKDDKKIEFVDMIDELMYDGYSIKFSKHPNGSTIMTSVRPDGEVEGHIMYPNGDVKDMEL